MDRYKFRAWNGEEMIIPTTIEPATDGLPKDITGPTVHYKDGFFTCCPRTGDVLMQCTGLKDKNGQLIYEGDILEHTYHKTIFDVTWADNSKHELPGWDHWDSPEQRVIIGNIHENPELLKE